jgi:serine/threonine protein kinase
MMSGDVHTGKVLAGRYAVGEPLGEGGWGAVYAATQVDLGRPVALKVLHTSMALSPDGLARFEREARAAAALGHPNIAQVTDFQKNPGEPPFLVMERLHGMTLGAALRAAPRMPAARVAWIAHQVLSALDAAHRAGIVHRDVKPDNVFLVTAPGIDDHVKLLDFGIAKLAGEVQLTGAGTMLGSPSFMAPEQVKNGLLDPRVDLWAVGATMYLALAGRPPFPAESLHALLFAICEHHPPPLTALDPDLDPRLSAIVLRALEKDPARRFASAGEMRDALEPWVSRTPVATALPPHLAHNSRPAPPPPYASVPAPVMSAPPPYASMPAPGMGAPPPPYASMPAPPSRGMSGVAIGLLAGAVVLLGLLVLGGIAAGAFLYAGGASADRSVDVAQPSAATAPAPGEAPGPSSVAATGALPEPSASVASEKPAGSASANAPRPAPRPKPTAAPARPQMAGASARISGGSYAPFKVAEGRAAVEPVMPAISACFAATEFDPPEHQFTDWLLEVDPAGVVTSARRTTRHEPHPKLDACVIAALRTTTWPATPGGGTPRISLSSRTRDNL